MYNVMCMSFDGDFVLERVNADSVMAAWDYAGDLGSKWFFYPFYFVVSESGQTIIDTPEGLEILKNKRVKTVKDLFCQVSKKPETLDSDAELFSLYLYDAACVKWGTGGNNGNLGD